MEITLRLSDGQKKTFSEEELVAIVEEHLQNQKAQKKETTEFASVPMEGKWFKVEPLTIDQNLFKEKRKNPSQERTRQLILEAFEEMKKNLKYAKSFKTMILEKTWSSKNVGELKELASKFGDHNADWVEQALEWAQRIANGEAWKDICNKADTANWYRLVIWKNGCARLVGGSREDYVNSPASDISGSTFFDLSFIIRAVPLVVLYE